MSKIFRQYRARRAQHVVSFHDGVKVHKDGSPFFDIRIFSNRIKKEKFIKKLLQFGYVET